jgi:hypothetical protein
VAGVVVRVQPAALWIIAFGIMAAACDNFIDYTVVNETGQDVMTSPFDEDCSDVPGNKQDHWDAEPVPAYETYDYFDATWAPDPGCILVTTTERRLVLAEPYEYGRTYTVSEPLPTSGPSLADLPSQSWLSAARENLTETPPVQLAFFLFFGILIWGGIFFGAFLVLRYGYRRYWRRS